MIVCTIVCPNLKAFTVTVRLECIYAKVRVKRYIKLIDYVLNLSVSMFTDGAALFNPVIYFFRPFNRTDISLYLFSFVVDFLCTKCFGQLYGHPHIVSDANSLKLNAS